MKLRSKFRYCAIGLVVILTLFVTVLHTPPVRRFAVSRLTGYLRSEQGIDLAVAAVRYNLLTLSVELDTAVFRSTSAPDLPPFLTVASARAGVRFLSLLRRKPVIEEARLDGVAVQMIVDGQGRDNLPRSGRPGKVESELPFLIADLEVAEGSFRYSDDASRIRASLPLWTLAARGDTSAWKQFLQFRTVRPGHAGFENRSLPVGGLTIDAELSSGLIALKGLDLAAAGSRLQASGMLRDFDRPLVEFRAAADLDAGSLAGIIGMEPGIGGRLEAEVAGSGPLADLTVSSRLVGTGLSDRGLQGVVVTASATWDRRSGRIRADSIEFASPFGSATGRADLALSQGAGVSSAEARFNGIDLETLSRGLRLPVRVGSRAAGSIRVRWPGMEFGQAEGHADIRLSPRRVRPSADVLPVAATASAAVSQGRVKLNIESAEALGVSLAGGLSLTPGLRLGGDLRARTESIGELARGLESFLGRERGSLTGARLDGPLSIEASLGGTLEEPQADASLAAPDTSAGDLRGIALTAGARYSSKRLVLDEAELSWAGQRLSARGAVGFEGESPTLDLVSHLDRGSLRAILAGLGRDIPLEGELDVEVAVGGTAGDPDISARAALSGLTAYGEELGTLTLQAGLAGRKVELERLELKQEGQRNGGLSAVGSYEPGSGSYTFQATAREFRIRNMTLPGEISVRGDLSLTAEGAGSLDDPSLQARLDLADLELGGRPLGAANLAARIEERQADLEVRVPQLNLSARAAVGIESPHPATIEANAEADLSALGIPLGDSGTLAGTVTARLQGSGDLERWRDGRALLSVENLALTAGGAAIRNDGPLELGYRNRRLELRSAYLGGGASRMSIAGSLPLEPESPPGVLELGGRLDLRGLSGILSGDPALSAAGDLHVDGRLTGSLQALTPSIKLGLREGVLNSPFLKVEARHVALDAEIDGGTALIHAASAEVGSAKLRADAKVPLGSLGFDLPRLLPAATGPARFSAEVEALRLSDLRDVPEPLTGSVDFRVEGESPRLTDFEALRARAILSRLELKAKEFAAGLTEAAEFSVAGGAVTVDRFQLAGPGTRVRVSGTAALLGDQPLDLRFEGGVDLGVATLFGEGFEAEGDSRFEVAVGGSLTAPGVSGFFETKEGQFTAVTPPLSATALDIRLRIDPKAVTIERFSGSLNGGALNVDGTVSYGDSVPADVRVNASVANAFLEYPEGLRTEVTADLTLRSQGESLILGGAAHLLEGSYRRPLDVAGELLGYLRSGSSSTFPAEQGSFLSRLRFNAALDTRGPLLIDNNLARLTLDADLRLTGSYNRPGLVGRVRLGEGGELYFNERTYLVERGTISFTNQARIEPELDIRATTRASGYDISLSLSGTPEDFSADLTSDPTLPQPDIIAVLLTGRRLEELQGSGLSVAREQVGSYLSGRLGGVLSRGAERTLGLSTVRIDPSLISPEANPGARLTVGEDVTNRLRLIYSMNLVDSNDQILSAQYDVTRRFQTEATRQSDNSYRFEFAHDLQFGGAQGAGGTGGRISGERRIGTITFAGNTVFPRGALQQRLGFEPGGKYDFFSVQKGLNRLRAYYRDRGYLECRVGVDRNERGRIIDLSLRVEAGPRVTIGFEGPPPEGKVAERVRSVWQAGLFDAQRTQDAVKIIRESEVTKGYLQARVEADVSALLKDEKHVRFRIEPGVRFRGVGLEFEGVSDLDPARLRAVLGSGSLKTEVYVDPRKVTGLLEDYYRGLGYLDARVNDPRYELDPGAGTGRIVIRVEEGPRFGVRSLAFKGNRELADQQLREALPFTPGGPYRPELLEGAATRLEELYWNRGFSQVVVSFGLNRAPEPGQLDVEFLIDENRQQVVEAVEIDGNRETGEDLIRSQISLSPGDVLDFGKANQSRRRLYETNAFTLVDIQSEPVTRATPVPAENREPVVLKVRVQEVRPFELRYGGFYDTERGAGGIVDFSNRNSLGSARLAGARFRYDSDVHELRGYFGQPLLRRVPVSTSATAFFRREITSGQDTPDSGFITDQTGFTVQQQARFGSGFTLSYGYRFQRNHSYDAGPDPFFDITLRTAPLTATLTRDTRDDLLDASRGSFASQAFEYAPSLLGSDLRYVKYFGQYFHYLPLSGPTVVPWSGVKRNRFVFAGAVRVGLAGGLGGQDLIPSDKFFAGGGTTLRGFGQNEVGPREFGDPVGGNGLLILNGELRFPIASIFDGVGFLDVGNVFSTVRDFSLSGLRKAGGFGLRVRTPYFILRADYGVKLDRQPGEPLGRFFFSIGQAF